MVMNTLTNTNQFVKLLELNNVNVFLIEIIQNIIIFTPMKDIVYCFKRGFQIGLSLKISSIFTCLILTKINFEIFF